MSIEPQCIFCGACDKNRCKTQPQADKCDVYARQKARTHHDKAPVKQPETGKISTDVSATFGIKLEHRSGDISLASGYGGLRSAYRLNITPAGGTTTSITITTADVENLKEMILQMQEHMKK